MRIVIAAVAAILSSSAPAADFTYSDHRALSELVVPSLNLSADIVSVRKGLPRDRYRNTDTQIAHDSFTLLKQWLDAVGGN